METCALTDIGQWLEKNRAAFLPPVCNKLMHEKQLKVFYVGGPNQRKDFHVEEGEELFYMREGAMDLIVVERGKFKTIQIAEGEVFLLPGCIPHSPQRQSDTVGLVIERERLPSELDCLRYFIPETEEVLFERWFYCDDLGTQLKPVIEEFFASQEYRTGKPLNNVERNPPYLPNNHRVLATPFPLKQWLTDNSSQLAQQGQMRLFDDSGSYQSDITVWAEARESHHLIHHVETWLWQLVGEAEIRVGETVFKLKQDQSFLVPPETSFSLRNETGARTMSVVMDPANKNEK